VATVVSSRARVVVGRQHHRVDAALEVYFPLVGAIGDCASGAGGRNLHAGTEIDVDGRYVVGDPELDVALIGEEEREERLAEVARRLPQLCLLVLCLGGSQPVRQRIGDPGPGSLDVCVKGHEDVRRMCAGMPLEYVALHALHKGPRVGLGRVQRIVQQVDQSHVRLPAAATCSACTVPRPSDTNNIVALVAGIGAVSPDFVGAPFIRRHSTR